MSSVLVEAVVAGATILPHLLLRIHTHTIHVDCEQNLLLHHLDAAVAGQGEIEEAGVAGGQHHILVALTNLWLDHEAHVLLDEGLVIGRKTLLAPAELDEALTFVLADFLKELPENLDQLRVGRVLRVISAIVRMALEKLDVDLTTAAYPRL